MIRARVEARVGAISDEAWKSTCKAIDKVLIFRNKRKLRNSTRHVLDLCICVASAKGLIQRRDV